jgi:excisionase family DNA binding protein
VEPLLISKRDTAAALAISVRGVERMIADGDLPAVRVRGAVRIPVAAVKKIANESTPSLLDSAENRFLSEALAKTLERMSSAVHLSGYWI